MKPAHTCQYRVYYEDTDTAGIVYYANYLKFAERARTEWLRELGFSQSKWLAESGIGFVVRHCEADFIAPARLDDMISIETHLQEASKVRMKMRQIIKRNEKTLADLTVTIACVKEGKPARLPPELEKLGKR
ncbi:MAG TPA: tol-pal system-associated acyl-CoA thioesterase [Rickettsiales bacterium]|nr:tol-pal system-associated acyl-CoA thioesterase [Rickettsiales bacterium]